MTASQLRSEAETVLSLSDHLETLKQRATELLETFEASRRGYFTPTEDEQTRHLLVSYWQSRNALFELVTSTYRAEQLNEEDRAIALTIAYAGALVLVDVARFLRDNCHHRPVVRRKLNEPEPYFEIPEGTYDSVQKSLTRPVHAWHLYHAMKFIRTHWKDLRNIGATEPEFNGTLDLIRRLQDRLDINTARFILARTRVRGRSLRTRLGSDLFGRAIYGLQKCVSAFMANKYVKLHHRPGLPQSIESELQAALRPGDVIVVRKEHAFTNYFLPGYWPHAALYLGTLNQLQDMQLHKHHHVGRKWSQIESLDPKRCHRVLESMKDGVHIRSLANPLQSDAVAVIRPRLSVDQISAAISRGLQHEGKSYDFDFDFSRSDRLVCTEVVYRSYEGVGGIAFELTRRAGRITLSAEDLLQKAVNAEGFDVQMVYCPAVGNELTFGEEAATILQSTIGRKIVS